MEKNQMIAVVSVAVLLIGAVGLVLMKDSMVDNAVLDASSDYTSSDSPPVIFAEIVYMELMVSENADTPYILSIRSSEQYALGHIPTAVNIPREELFKGDNLEKLPSDRKIIVVDDDGHNATGTAAILSILGHQASAMKHGMSSWTTNTTVAPVQINEKEPNNYPIITGIEPGTLADAILPMTNAEILREAARDYFAGGMKYISASALYSRLTDTNTTNDPYILDIRVKDDYDNGHINGSTHQSIRTMFTLENLSTLPIDNDIVVMCYSGQSSGQATALLNVLGFDAFSLTYGMGSWNTTVATKTFNASVHQNSFETVNACGCDDPAGTKGTSKDLSYPHDSREWKVIQEAAYEYASTATFTMAAADLNTLTTDMDNTNDPFIYDARLFHDYQLSKIPKSTSFGNKNIFDAGIGLPPSNLIVVYCYTGQNSAQISALLNINGYNAISLLHGMCSWTDNPVTDLGGKCYKSDVHGNDYPVETTV